jgi:hypothetical protein
MNTLHVYNYLYITYFRTNLELLSTVHDHHPGSSMEIVETNSIPFPKICDRHIPTNSTHHGTIQAEQMLLPGTGLRHRSYENP